MLSVSRVVVRDRGSRALLFVVDVARDPVRIEAADGALTVEHAATGRPLVQAPVAILEILNDEAVQFAAAARLKGERELRHVRVTFELPAVR
ncbi:MAG TPA: hypothetical protein PKB06_04620 [Actinotalea sp.]|nr:hypothetical protein [Actinotalea sp.]